MTSVPTANVMANEEKGFVRFRYAWSVTPHLTGNKLKREKEIIRAGYDAIRMNP